MILATDKQDWIENNNLDLTFITMSKIFLLKTYTTKDGNIYYPGEYDASNPLPFEILNNPLYVKQSVQEFVSEQKPKPVEEHISVNKQETKVDEVTGNFEINKTTKESDVEIKAVHSKEKVDKLKINEATFEQIQGLKGVGKVATNKVIEYRELAPFINYTDLNERVPLGFGNSWEKFEIEF